jgi:hypothetical protein
VSQFSLGSVIAFWSCSTAVLYRISVLSRSLDVGGLVAGGRVVESALECVSTPSLSSVETLGDWIAGALTSKAGEEDVVICSEGSINVEVAGWPGRSCVFGLREKRHFGNRLPPLFLWSSESIEDSKIESAVA